MAIDFSSLNNVSNYSDNVEVNSHLPAITFDDGSVSEDGVTYDNFGFAVLSKNVSMRNGESLRDKVSESRALKADKLGLRGQAYSDFVENGVNTVNSKRDMAIQSLPTVPDDKTFEKDPAPASGGNLLEVLKNGQDNLHDILSENLNAMNEITTLLVNQNEILKEKNKIDLERNRLKEVAVLSQDGLNKVLVESNTSIAQSLEYLPTLIETIAIGNDKKADLLNTQNSHLLQKNVNDAYAFNYNKDDEKSPQRSLDAIAGHLAVNANSTKKISEDHEKVAKQAENETKDWEDENSEGYLSVLSDIQDFLSGAKDSFVDNIDDVDIFTYLIQQGSMNIEGAK